MNSYGRSVLKHSYLPAKYISRIITVLFLLFLFRQTAISEETPKPFREKAKIVKVYDGDSILLQDGREVRLLGVDAPELHHPTLPEQRFGKEAADFVRKIAEGKECELEYEEGNKKDKYKRTIAYVYIGDKLLNAELLKNGFAYVYIKYPFHLKNEFIRYQQEAIKLRNGLWNIKDKSGEKK